MNEPGSQGSAASRCPARRRRLLVLTLVTLLGGLLILPPLAWSIAQLLPLFDASVPEYSQQPPRVGEGAPEFVLRDLDGAIVRLSELAVRKPVVIEFGSAT